MEAYIHTVQYYETDKMGITHHSNYMRWMEEARVDFLKKIGWDYKMLEEEGIFSPVIEISCKYKSSTTFTDEIKINISVKEFKGVKLILYYEMINEQGISVCEGSSIHCFIDINGRPINLAKKFRGFYEALRELAEEYKTKEKI